MQPRNGEETKYFFIVSQYSRGKLVLDIKNGKKSGILRMVEPERGRSSQLWRWDESCRLVSKLGLVADIKGASKKEEAVCRAWKAHDGLSQKWRVEKSAIVSNSSHLVIDSSPPTAQVFMRKFKDDSEHQKWHFVPEVAWDDFQLSLREPNPLEKALFWKKMADNYLDVVIGYSIEEFEARVRRAFKVIDECACSLEEVTKGTGIAGTVGGSVSVVGGAVAIAGIVLAPVTAGVSLALTVGGSISALTGSTASLTANLVHGQLDKHKRRKVNEATASLFCTAYRFHSLLGEFGKYLQDADKFLTEQKHETCTDSIDGKVVAVKENTNLETASATGKVAKNICGHAKEIKRLVTFIKANAFVYRGADIGISTSAAAPGVTVPVVGKTLLIAGSTGAKVFSGTLAGFGVLTGFYDIYSGAKKIQSCGELAGEFRTSSESLREEADRLICLYKELHRDEECKQ